MTRVLRAVQVAVAAFVACSLGVPESSAQSAAGSPPYDSYYRRLDGPDGQSDIGQVTNALGSNSQGRNYGQAVPSGGYYPGLYNQPARGAGGAGRRLLRQLRQPVRRLLPRPLQSARSRGAGGAGRRLLRQLRQPVRRPLPGPLQSARSRRRRRRPAASTATSSTRPAAATRASTISPLARAGGAAGGFYGNFVNPSGGRYPGLYNQPARAVPAAPAGGFYGNFVNPSGGRYPGLNARPRAAVR